MSALLSAPRWPRWRKKDNAALFAKGVISKILFYFPVASSIMEGMIHRAAFLERNAARAFAPALLAVRPISIIAIIPA